MTHGDMVVSPVFRVLATIDVATLVLRQASFVLRASLRLRTKPALGANKENQARGGRAGGEGTRFASWWKSWNAARDFTTTGTVIAPATGGMPWKHNDRQAAMQGQALPGEDLSGEEVSEEDVLEADLACWHGMSSTAPAAVDAWVVRSMPFMVAA
jgi:hypothetical protein